MSQITTEEADTIIDYIESMEEAVRHERTMNSMAQKGYTPEQVDQALKSLGRIVGRDCGIF
jgi:DNA-binding phage protein